MLTNDNKASVDAPFVDLTFGSIGPVGIEQWPRKRYANVCHRKKMALKLPGSLEILLRCWLRELITMCERFAYSRGSLIHLVLLVRSVNGDCCLSVKSECGGIDWRSL
jgi:hypothetical protein